MIERFRERLPLVRPLVLPAVLYVVLMMAAALFIETYPVSPWRLPVILASMIPGLFLAIGIIRTINKLDEMGRKIIIDSAAVTFAVTLFVVLTLGLLETFDLLQVNILYLSPFMALCLLAVKLILSHRYE